MLTIKAHAGPSRIEGKGLFADEFIPSGTVLWKFDPDYDIVVRPEILQQLNDSEQKNFFKYSYRDTQNGLYVLCCDDARFMNHS